MVSTIIFFITCGFYGKKELISLAGMMGFILHYRQMSLFIFGLNSLILYWDNMAKKDLQRIDAEGYLHVEDRNMDKIKPLADVYENGNPPYVYGFESASYSQVPVNGTGFSEPLPFTILPYDEFRVSGSEDLVWQITRVSHSYNAGVSTELFATLDRPYTGSYPPDYFLIRRYVTNPSLVIVESTSSVVNAGGGTGFLLPQYKSEALTTNFNDIIQNLAQKNLI